MRILQAGVMLLGALMYGAVIVFPEALSSSNLPWTFVIGGVWNLLLLMATVVVIVDSIQKIRAKKTQQLATDVLVVKLAAIPFFVLNFVVLANLTVLGLGLIIFGGMVLWVVVAIGAGLTYMVVLSTSVYAWAAIVQIRRDGIIKPWLAVLYAILSLVFVTDTATGILLFGHGRRRPKLALVIVLLSFGLGLAGVGLGLDLSFGFGWISVAGIVALLAAIVVGVVLLPALRRESGRLAPPGGITTGEVTPDRVLGS